MKISSELSSCIQSFLTYTQSSGVNHEYSPDVWIYMIFRGRKLKAGDVNQVLISGHIRSVEPDISNEDLTAAIEERSGISLTESAAWVCRI